jgi:aldose 1-epimerase
VPWGQLAWELVDVKKDYLRALLDWHRPEFVAVFPYPHRLEITAELSPTSLHLRTEVSADANSPVPISFGFHPYLGIPALAREHWRLQLPAMTKLQLDQRGIPTGASTSFGPSDGLLAQSSFDDGYALLNEEASFRLSGANWNITINFLEGFRYLQVFAPAGKEFIALEPMTAPANALISGDGLRILESGTQFRASFRIDVYSN